MYNSTEIPNQKQIHERTRDIIYDVQGISEEAKESPQVANFVDGITAKAIQAMNSSPAIHRFPLKIYYQLYFDVLKEAAEYPINIEKGVIEGLEKIVHQN